MATIATRPMRTRTRNDIAERKAAKKLARRLLAILSLSYSSLASQLIEQLICSFEQSTRALPASSVLRERLLRWGL